MPRRRPSIVVADLEARVFGDRAPRPPSSSGAAPVFSSVPAFTSSAAAGIVRKPAYCVMFLFNKWASFPPCYIPLEPIFQNVPYLVPSFPPYLIPFAPKSPLHPPTNPTDFFEEQRRRSTEWVLGLIVVIGCLLSFFLHIEKHGIQIVKGLFARFEEVV
ncbi:hypothetical protein MRB53_023258 [Persea americana]|uniref:Uncharacterized protein n=1 Tax=Persea americana TaxID=3435 RepID=A0ACC2L9A1_PERAE|nr:hypothetical protein MRB53_023258 [Persea americana]